MSKQVNLNIGMIACFQCGDTAAVRKNKNGLLYFDCLNCGRITPNLQGGQDKILERAKIWGNGEPVADCPRWIAEQWPWGKSLNDLEGRKPRAVNKAASAESPRPAPEITPEADSVNDDLPTPPPKKKPPAHEPAAAGSIWDNF
jgi:hypothetical protein